MREFLRTSPLESLVVLLGCVPGHMGISLTRYVPRYRSILIMGPQEGITACGESPYLEKLPCRLVAEC